MNESFEKVGSNGLAANMILYMLNDYQMDATNATTILFMWSALASGLDSVCFFYLILNKNFFELNIE